MIELQRISRIARCALALIFFYHGLVPKLLWLSPIEVQMITAHGLGEPRLIAALAGWLELAMGTWLLSGRAPRAAIGVTAAVLSGLLLDVAIVAPQLLSQAFNPVTVNGAGLALCWVAWLATRVQPPGVPGAEQARAL